MARPPRTRARVPFLWVGAQDESRVCLSGSHLATTHTLTPPPHTHTHPSPLISRSGGTHAVTKVGRDFGAAWQGLVPMMEYLKNQAPIPLNVKANVVICSDG